MEKVILDGEELKISNSFKNITDVEKEIGSIYGFTQKISDRTVTVSDVVNTYYHMQSESSYSKQQLFEKIIKDGLVKHMSMIGQIFMPNLVGNQTVQEALDKAKEQETSEKKLTKEG